MREKYPLSLLDSPNLTQTAKDSINHFHNFKYQCPEIVLNSYPSIMTCCILKEQIFNDHSVCKRLISVLLAALRSHGSFGEVLFLFSENLEKSGKILENSN